MQKEVDNILVEIPEALPARVGEALSQVRAIHRRRVLRRLGGAVGSVVAVLAATVTLAAVNPALASQIPLVGDWLGSLFFALGVTGLGRRGGESLSTPAMIAWVLFVTEVVSVLLRPEGMFAVGIGVLFVILEVWLYLLVAGILDERFPEAELSIRPISILGVVSAVGYVMTMAFGSGILGVLCLLTGVAMKVWFMVQLAKLSKIVED